MDKFWLCIFLQCLAFSKKFANIYYKESNTSQSYILQSIAVEIYTKKIIIHIYGLIFSFCKTFRTYFWNIRKSLCANTCANIKMTSACSENDWNCAIIKINLKKNCGATKIAELRQTTKKAIFNQQELIFNQ